MKLIICETCGANDWENHNGYMIVQGPYIICVTANGNAVVIEKNE